MIGFTVAALQGIWLCEHRDHGGGRWVGRHQLQVAAATYTGINCIIANVALLMCCAGVWWSRCRGRLEAPRHSTAWHLPAAPNGADHGGSAVVLGGSCCLKLSQECAGNVALLDLAPSVPVQPAELCETSRALSPSPCETSKEQNDTLQNPVRASSLRELFLGCLELLLLLLIILACAADRPGVAYSPG